MQVARIEMLLAEEENKRSKWKQENIRRRHNYLPLIMEMLRSTFLYFENVSFTFTCFLDHLPAGENCCLSIIRRKKRQWRLKRRRKTRKQPPKFDVFLTSEIFIRFDKSKMSTV